MKPFTWRITLSTASLVAAVVLSALGTREYQLFRRLYPLAFYEGNFIYIPPAQVVSGCVNSPAFVLSNLLGNTQAWRSLGDGVPPARAASALFYALVVLLWWWIGWRFDIGLRRNSLTVLAAPFWMVGGILSLLLTYAGSQIFIISQSDGIAGGRAIAVSMFVWGLALSCYCVRMLMNW